VLGHLIVDAVADAYPGHDVRMVAVNLRALEEVARVLDTLAVALIQSLGDWHVLHAVREALTVTEWISTALPEDTPKAENAPPASQESGYLPAVDMFDLLDHLRETLADEVQRTPTSYGQRQRITHLHTLVEKALQVLVPDAASDTSRLLLHARPAAGHGLSICLPPPHSPEQPDQEADAVFHLAQSNYLQLQFSRHVQWAALVGAFQLITEKPHALWRMISGLLADASGPARDALLQRLVGPDSLIDGMQQQFQALGANQVLTLSLDPKEELTSRSDAQRYRLRLESSIAGATIPQQDSRVYGPTLEAALQGLERLLNSFEETPDLKQNLRALGRTLGEDLIQDLAERLEAERSAATDGLTDGTPHLRLQIPRELMRYPWELMHDRHGMLCERFALGRQVFMETQLTRRLMRRKPGPVEVLIIGDPQFDYDRYQQAYRFQPRQLPGAQHEARTVAAAFARLREELAGLPSINVTPLIGTTVTVGEFRQCLRSGQFDIIHYAGHARFDQADPEGSAWLLSDGLLHAREIRNTLAWTESPPWLVFANACEAGMDAGTPVGRYQGDVFGLATAFINQAVTAYIAPLWPVDDAVAAQLAEDFYRALLLERASLGEALRRAKVRAKQDLLGPDGEEEDAVVPPSVALSWASVVLYGDPTPRLLESLWTPYAERSVSREKRQRPSEPASRQRATRVRVRRLAQAPADTTRQLVSGPGMRSVSLDATRGAALPPLETPQVELIEINGLRTWQIIDPQTGQRQPLPGSTIAAAAAKETVRGALGWQRGWKDYVRVIGRWVVDRITGEETPSLLTRLVEQYDKDTVASEQLLLINPGPQLTPLPRPPEPWTWLSRPLRAGQVDRVLVLIHGTFSKTAAPVDGLGEDFLHWARETYRGVIGFDHWTLSKTPEDNARLLWELLDPQLHTGQRLDIITHSRGGLVARAFIELLGHGEAVRRVVFAGTPNAGTSLANPENWSRAADVLVNLAHLDPAGLYGKLSGFLVNLLVSGAVGEIPGLQAQNPEAKGKQQFLGRLQTPDPLPAGVTYAAVAANYEPDREDFNLKRVLGEAGDSALDEFYGAANDLVVDTAHVWAADAEPTLQGTGSAIPATRVLLFNPDPRVPSPPGVQLHRLSGVHHTNLFSWEPTRRFLQQQLTMV
jgi:CHAT domain-containing protein